MTRQKVVSEPDTKDSEIEVLKQQVAMLMEQLNIKNNNPKPESKKLLIEDIDKSDDIYISSDSYVKVMSLVGNVLNLHTQSGGRGKTFRFPEFGSVKRILYKDLVDIMEADAHFLEAGFFFIMSRDVVRKHGLDDLYAKILSKEKIDQILSGNQSDAVNLFKSTNERQREVIVQIILDRMMQGEMFDQNLLYRLSESFNPEFTIMDRFKEMRDSNSGK